MLKLHGSPLLRDSTSNFSSMTLMSYLPDTLLNTWKDMMSRKHLKGRLEVVPVQGEDSRFVVERCVCCFNSRRARCRCVDFPLFGFFSQYRPSVSLVVYKRRIAPGIPDIKGITDGHNSVPVKSAVKYLHARGYSDLFPSKMVSDLFRIHTSTSDPLRN